MNSIAEASSREKSNKPEDTEGCLLVGFNKVKGQLVDSRKAFDTLYRMLADEVKRGKRIFIEIR